MDLQLAGSGDPGALTVAADLRNAETTKTGLDHLFTEFGRGLLLREADAGGSPAQMYQERYDVTGQTMEARLEGFRQAVGVPLSKLLDLKDEAQARRSEKVSLMEAWIVPVLEESHES